MDPLKNDPAARESLRLDLDLLGLRALVEKALAEDIGREDVTVRGVLGPTEGDASRRSVTARISAKAEGVIAGAPLAALAFQVLDSKARIRYNAQDGQRVSPEDPVLTVTGRTGALLSAERTALNFLGRLSGMASLTRRFVDAIGDLPCALCDTRKTTPGWRILEKYATAQGGARNHRIGLFDQVLIKENHLRAAGVGLGEAVAACVRELRDKRPDAPVLVGAEAETLAEVDAALVAGADLVLLDEFSLEDMREAVRRRDAAAGDRRAALEASGGITLATVRAVAETGVDRISVGAVTHSAPALDLTCLIDPVG